MPRPIARSRRRGRSAEDVLARGALLRLIAQGFGYPGPGAAEEMRRAFARLDPPLTRGAFPIPLKASIERARRAWRGVDDDGLAAEYLRLFQGSGPVSLHETAYGDGCRPGGRPVEIADVSGFYLAFGVEPSEANPEIPDHVGAEAEYLSLLLLKEAFARIQRQNPELALTRDAARKFVEDHLGRWAPNLRNRLKEAKAAPPYQAHAALLAAAVEAEGRRLAARPKPIQGLALCDEMQAETFVCPLGAQPRG